MSAALRASSAPASAFSAPARSEAGDDVLVSHVPVQQENLDQRASAVPITVRLARGGSPGVVDRGEPAHRAGLLERGRPRQRAGFADQGLQVVIQLKEGAALGQQPLVPSVPRRRTAT